MPIYEYRCTDCGNSFEKLVRRSTDSVECPGCQGAHLEQQYSSFAAQTGGGSEAGFCNTPAMTRSGGGCGAGMCGTGGCGMKN